MPPDRSLRLAFVGQQVYFAGCSLEDELAGLTPAFFELDPRSDGHAVAAALSTFDPDAVIVFRPDMLPAGTLDDLRAVTLGWLTEPLPRPGGPAHPDLELRLEALHLIDAGQFDRLVSFDPLVTSTVETVAPVWRSLPLPVSDRLYAPVQPSRPRPRLLFVGRSTVHRESFLAPLKHDFDVVHIAHGVAGEDLVPFLRAADVAVNLHNEPYATFENRVQTSLAAGLLVITEPVSPHHGLVPNVELLEAAAPWAMWELVRSLVAAPDAFRTLRVAGRRAAERFRASTVYPALVREAIADVELFGGRRARSRDALTVSR